MRRFDPFSLVMARADPLLDRRRPGDALPVPLVRGCWCLGHDLARAVVRCSLPFLKDYRRGIQPIKSLLLCSSVASTEN